MLDGPFFTLLVVVVVVVVDVEVGEDLDFGATVLSMIWLRSRYIFKDFNLFSTYK